MLPNLRSRAVSLVAWMSEVLDDGIRELLLMQELGDRVLDSGITSVFVGSPRCQVWERSWRLGDHTGIIVDVCVQVGEEDDAEVVVRVGGRVVMTAVPPWIADRGKYDPVIDAGIRQGFNNQLLYEIEQELAIDRRLQGLPDITPRRIEDPTQVVEPVPQERAASLSIWKRQSSTETG
jgi:hypothetical protein